MALNDLFRIAVQGRGPQDQQLVNTLYYRQSSLAVVGDELEVLAQAYFDNAIDSGLYPALVHANCSFIGLQVRGITNPETGFDLNFEEAIPGASTGDMLPPATSCVVTWNTGFIGRRNRGRNYLWPASESNQSQGVWGAGYLDAVQDYAEAIRNLDVLLVGSYQQVVYSRTFDAFRDVISATPKPIVNGQERRKPGVGS